jgi:hypothetical protein
MVLVMDLLCSVQQVKLYEQYRGWLREAKQESSTALEHERALQQTSRVDLERSTARINELQKELESEKGHSSALSRQIIDLKHQLDRSHAHAHSLQVIPVMAKLRILNPKFSVLM